MIDPTTPPHIVAAIAALAGAVIGSVGNGIAHGFLQWRRNKAEAALAERKFNYDRRQTAFKRRFEVAEQLLADAYRFRSLMTYVRNGGASSGEGSSREAEPNETERVKSLRNSYFVPLERLQKQNEFISAFFAKRATARALFGPEAETAFGLFHEGLHKTQISAQLLVQWSGEQDFADPALMKRMQEDIWEPLGAHAGKNEIGQKLDEGVELVERFCRPVLAWVEGE